MKKLALATALTIAAMASGVSAQAMPVLTAGPFDSGIVRVEGGCGPGGHRGPYGRCYPNYNRGFRGCPPGFHPTPYGRCRPNF